MVEFSYFFLYRKVLLFFQIFRILLCFSIDFPFNHQHFSSNILVAVSKYVCQRTTIYSAQDFFYIILLTVIYFYINILLVMRTIPWYEHQAAKRIIPRNFTRFAYAICEIPHPSAKRKKEVQKKSKQPFGFLY